MSPCFNTRESWVVLDGAALLTWLTSATHVAAGVPRSIDELAHGNPRRIAEQWADRVTGPGAVKTPAPSRPARSSAASVADPDEQPPLV